MALLDWLRGPRPVTAAAASIADPRDMDQMFNAGARSVGEAWKIWHLVGEIQYATNQQARLVSRVDWDTVINGDKQDREDSTEMLDATFGNQLADLAQASALNLQVGGGYILARWPQKTDGQWDVVSLQQDHHMKELLAKADIRVKVTNPDPTNPKMTVSPVIAAIDVATDLLLARAQSRAHRRNRTAQQGILLYPNEGAGQDPDLFKKQLLTTITAPLMDEKSAASVVPNLVGFAGDKIDQWKYLEIAPTFDTKLHEQIQSLVRQLAMILDSPPEILLGMGDVNHWSSWAIQEDNWFGHSEPLARRVGEGFAEAIAVAADLDPSVVEVLPDPSPLLKRRPALSDVQAAHAARVVSDEYYRAQLGADEEDAPDALREEPEEEQPDPVPVEEDPSSTAPVAPVVPLPVAAAAPVRVPDPERLQQIDAQAYDAIGDLISDASERALERLGAKLRSQAARSNIELPADKSNAEVAIAYEGVIPGADQAIEDTATAWSAKVGRVVTRAYKQLADAGVPLDLDETALKDAQGVFVQAVEDQVARRLVGGTGDAELWADTRRVVSIAGGNPDPAPKTAAARPITDVGTGIALGQRSIDLVKDTYQVTVGSYRWLHRAGKDSHPKHMELDGRVFNGEYLLNDGVNWFPGDHAGCLCVALPVFERIAA